MLYRLLVVLGLFSLVACTNMSNEQVRNAGIGAAVGAGAGVLIGDNTESTVTGAVVGGLIGSQVQ